MDIYLAMEYKLIEWIEMESIKEVTIYSQQKSILLLKW